MTTNKPTPETDALEQSLNTWTIRELDEAMSFARKLERERDDAREQIETIEIRHAAAMMHAQSVVDENTQLQKSADELAIELRDCVNDLNCSPEKSKSLKSYNQLPHVIERNKK